MQTMMLMESHCDRAASQSFVTVLPGEGPRSAIRSAVSFQSDLHLQLYVFANEDSFAHHD